MTDTLRDRIAEAVAPHLVDMDAKAVADAVIKTLQDDGWTLAPPDVVVFTGICISGMGEAVTPTISAEAAVTAPAVMGMPTSRAAARMRSATAVATGPHTARNHWIPPMSDSLRDRMLRELARHFGGWIDNGKPDSHCQCGHRGRLGEHHSRHVADAILAIPGIAPWSSYRNRTRAWASRIMSPCQEPCLSSLGLGSRFRSHPAWLDWLPLPCSPPLTVWSVTSEARTSYRQPRMGEP